MHHGPVSPEIAAGLLALKKRIDAAKIPSSKLDETINIAIWNIREFGKVKRTDTALHYIAEIICQFDLVATLELRNNLEDLGCVVDYLDDSWKVIYSDWPTIAAATMSAPPFCMSAGLLLIMVCR